MIFILNKNTLIAVDLSIQQEIDVDPKAIQQINVSGKRKNKYLSTIRQWNKIYEREKNVSKYIAVFDSFLKLSSFYLHYVGVFLLL